MFQDHERQMRSVLLLLSPDDALLPPARKELADSGYRVIECNDLGACCGVLREEPVAAVLTTEEVTDVVSLGETMWQLRPDATLVVVGDRQSPKSGWTDAYLRLPVPPGAFAQALEYVTA